MRDDKCKRKCKCDYKGGMLGGMPMKKMVCSVWVVGVALSICNVGHAQTAKDGVVFPSAGGERRRRRMSIRGMNCWLRKTAEVSRLITWATATTAGAKYFYNPIRKGSVASDESVTDAMTGKPLEFAVVSGAEAKKDPLMARADEGTDYIKVVLALRLFRRTDRVGS